MISGWTMILALLLVALIGGFYGWNKARLLRHRSARNLHSQPVYHSIYVGLWSVVPAAILILAGCITASIVITRDVTAALPETTFDMVYALQQVRAQVEDGRAAPAELAHAVDVYKQQGSYASWVILVNAAIAALLGLWISQRSISLQFPARFHVERYVKYLLIFCSSIAVLITASIILSVLFEALRFFDQIPLTAFLFGTHWNPQTASGSEAIHSFGAIPLFVGTFLIMVIAMIIAAPVGLFAAIYMAEYASRGTRTFAKPVLEILAGIPTVVYGYFAIVTISPLLRSLGASLGLDVASESALVAGLVMGVMIIPFISSLSDDVITAIPQSLREASLGLGATRSETIKQVVLPAALPGIMGAMLLAISRAIGETMIVVMAAGLAANMTFNPLESVTTVTAQIVAMLVGDQQFDSPKTLVAFALGLTLFVLTLILNIVALLIVKAYREKYE